MERKTPTNRRWRNVSLGLCPVVLAVSGFAIAAMPSFAFRGHEPRPAHTFSNRGPDRGGGPRDGGPNHERRRQDLPHYRGNPHHLGGWLQRHGNMPFADQKNALSKQRGFQRLSPEMQQRLLGRLKQIDEMPPRERERTVDRIEAMERLSPKRRREVRSSVKAIHDLPPDRQRMVRMAFRDLRNDPPDERRKILSSPEFKKEFNPKERDMLSNVLAIEPYEPSATGNPGSSR